jgi:hypothetical protein
MCGSTLLRDVDILKRIFDNLDLRVDQLVPGPIVLTKKLIRTTNSDQRCIVVVASRHVENLDKQLLSGKLPIEIFTHLLNLPNQNTSARRMMM